MARHVTAFTRRRLLVLGGAAIAAQTRVGNAAARGLELAAQQHLPAPHKSGIEHIVLLMMENRSFDHLLGWLPGADGKQSGLSYKDRSGQTHATYPLAPDFQGCGHPDPDHSYEGGRIQFDNGKCDGFLRSGKSDRYAIGYYRRVDLPFLGNAARDWTVCDRYFSAVMSETYPNRSYAHAAATESMVDTDIVLTLPTIWDRLAERGVSGVSYHGIGDPFLGNWGTKFARIIHRYEAFLAACHKGRLPHVAYVDPPRGRGEAGLSEDDHPFGDVRVGDAFMNQVYRAVIASPNWPSTVLVITFDEWGGFFDHVPPPRAVDANPQAVQRGFRVPCLVISPFARRRHIAHTVFDHTSVLRMIEWRWGLRPLNGRDRAANNLAAALDFSRRRLQAPRYAVPAFRSKPC